jgi:hypothetical protein
LDHASNFNASELDKKVQLMRSIQARPIYVRSFVRRARRRFPRDGVGAARAVPRGRTGLSLPRACVSLRRSLSSVQ